MSLRGCTPQIPLGMGQDPPHPGTPPRPQGPLSYKAALPLRGWNPPNIAFPALDPPTLVLDPPPRYGVTAPVPPHVPPGVSPGRGPSAPPPIPAFKGGSGGVGVEHLGGGDGGGAARRDPQLCRAAPGGGQGGQGGLGIAPNPIGAPPPGPCRAPPAHRAQPLPVRRRDDAPEPWGGHEGRFRGGGTRTGGGVPSPGEVPVLLTPGPGGGVQVWQQLLGTGDTQVGYWGRGWGGDLCALGGFFPAPHSPRVG